MYGDVQVAKSITDCVTSIAKTGIKRAFPKCKAYIKQVTEFCRSPNGKKTRAKDCKSVSVSISIAIDECDVLAQKRKPVTELCKALVPPKMSKANCKPNQLFGQVPGGSTTPMCFDAPLNKRSKTQVLPIRMYRPFPSKNFAQLQSLTNFTQVQGHDPTTAYAQNPSARVIIKTLPIGQGDCTVIYCPTTPGQFHAILFDCGARGGTFLPIEYFQSHLTDATSITVMISHGHADHYNRIPKVFDTTPIGLQLISKIKEVIVGGPQGDYSAATISRWLNYIANHEHKPVHFISGLQYQQLSICPDPDIVFEVATRAAQTDSKNERGMVMKLSCEPCGSQLLLAGDMEGHVADEMVTHSSNFLHATHYKMAHHGASTKANQMNWLQAISPVEVHVSHRYNGGYKHPRCEALNWVWPSLGTAVPIGGKGRRLDCFDTNHNLVQQTDIYHRVYSTAPTGDELCSITLTFASDPNKEKRAETDIFCGGPDAFGVSPVEITFPDDPGENEYD